MLRGSAERREGEGIFMVNCRVIFVALGMKAFPGQLIQVIFKAKNTCYDMLNPFKKPLVHITEL